MTKNEDWRLGLIAAILLRIKCSLVGARETAVICEERDTTNSPGMFQLRDYYAVKSHMKLRAFEKLCL